MDVESDTNLNVEQGMKIDMKPDRESGIMQIYKQWSEKAIVDLDVIEELKQIEGDTERITDAFYKNLEFGTGGLRGLIGAGTNRMNIHTVAKATQGIANYLKHQFPQESLRTAISYDSRIKSDIFAKVAAEVLAANQIDVHIYSELMPTPCLSFAVRKLECACGIMITASHNPAKYNGYKVYGADGGQITDDAAAVILAEIEALDVFEDVKRITFEEGVENDKIHYIQDEVTTAYMEQVKALSLEQAKEAKHDMTIVYSPLNGTGRKPVLTCLSERGFCHITVVKEQEFPDGTFPTCPYPNPEIKEAMSLGMEYAKQENADIVLATDPDCDRVGIAVKAADGRYTLLSGNETGVLLLDYICSRRIGQEKMPEHPIMVKSIVTTDMAERIAADYGVETINVLTGFKYIGEVIGRLKKQGQEKSYIFGFEESYGYLSGTHVRDKDAVNGALLICDMFAYYKENGISLTDKLDALYQRYGYWVNTLQSFQFEGARGMDQMQQIMQKIRNGISDIGGYKVIKCVDYKNGLDGLPKSNVVKFLLENQSSVVFRPSGTEPKLKAYVSACSKSKAEAESVNLKISDDIQMNIVSGK